MSQPLRVLVAGTGFAGKGHCQAFRASGAEVVGMVGRTEHIVGEVTRVLNIPYGSTDWDEALKKLRPDVVSIATPGGAHVEAIKAALAAGCHVFCEKPLATTGAEAQELAALANAKGVKTAYAASFQYAPGVQHAKGLIASGAIGALTEIESISHFNLERGIPFGWSHRAEAGGGRLNNNFTHSLAIVQALTDGEVTQISADIRDDLGQAPIVDGVHDFTKRRSFIPKDIDDPALSWGQSNVEWSYTVMARLNSPLAENFVSVLFKHGGLVPRYHEDHIVIYGTGGAIYLQGHYGSGPLWLHQGTDWVEVPTPARILAMAPAGLGETERCWHILAGLFLRDIGGAPVPAYPDFETGRFHQQLIDVIRRSEAWEDVASLNERETGT